MRTVGRRHGQHKKHGFTLVEIIAVLIILAILAAVAVPRFMDLTARARELALQGALAEGLSMCSLAYARAALTVEGQPTIAQVNSNISTNGVLGDFNVTFAPVGNSITVTVTRSEWPTPNSTNRAWNLPGNN